LSTSESEGNIKENIIYLSIKSFTWFLLFFSISFKLKNSIFGIVTIKQLMNTLQNSLNGESAFSLSKDIWANIVKHFLQNTGFLVGYLKNNQA